MIKVIKREDIAPDSIKSLDNTIGLTDLKKKAHEMYERSVFDRFREYNDVNRRSPNFLFIGNPGTGKTTAAIRMGKILKDCKISRTDHVEIADRSTLIGEYIGQTAGRVKEAVKKAIGGVLFIDEAYSLAVSGSSLDYGKEAISTLIKEMEDHKSDLVVILAGYPNLMVEFMRTNPGLESRFTETIHFEDYSNDELARIAERYCERNGFSLTEDGRRAFIATIEKRRYSDRFGNAREVEQILERAFKRKASNFFDGGMTRDDMKLIDAACFSGAEDEKETAQKYMSELAHMIGLSSAKQAISSILDAALYEKEEVNLGYSKQDKKVIAGHYCFVGNPGTGKTSVARLFGKILYANGITKTDTFIEAAREDLVAGYAGQTAIRTHELCERAYGGILFVDEAYSLVQGANDSFGLEAVATLLKEMEDNRQKLTVILAGYRREMETFLAANSGLKSRITEIIDFEDYSEAQLESIFINIEDKYDVVCSPEAQKAIRERIRNVYGCRDELFGNGREVRRLFEYIHGRMKSRVVREHITDRYERHLILAEDVA